MSIDEPAVDLGVVMAVVSSLKNMPLPQDMAFFGEVGLSGEIRSVSQPLVRIKEAQSLGFGTILLPAGNLAALDKNDLPAIQCVGVKTVRQALDHVF
jgi:DNA repair protein RadA/Sms